MLPSDGIHSVEGGVKICVCYDCYTPLSATPPHVPKFTLKNNVYRGSLPIHLTDLTWVEEQVCALYRPMALVTRLYGSDDPCQPHVFCGNPCAFARNTLSTAKKLPRTPSDVNDVLSVVFTGPSEKVPESCLKNVFRVRKQQIPDFLDLLQRCVFPENTVFLDDERSNAPAHLLTTVPPRSVIWCERNLTLRIFCYIGPKILNPNTATLVYSLSLMRAFSFPLVIIAALKEGIFCPKRSAHPMLPTPDPLLTVYLVVVHTINCLGKCMFWIGFAKLVNTLALRLFCPRSARESGTGRLPPLPIPFNGTPHSTSLVTRLRK